MHADDLSGPATPSPPPGLVITGHFDQRPGYRVNRPHGADSWLFTWTTGGRGRLLQGTATAEADAGDLVVLGPGVPHRYAVAPGARQWTFWWAHCQARPSWSGWLRPYARGDRLFLVDSVPGDVHDRIGAAFDRMLADARWSGSAAPPDPGPGPGIGPPVDRTAVAHSSAARELALCALEEAVLLATVTAGAARREPGGAGIDPRVRRAQALIAADPGAAHTVGSLADSVSLSPSRLAHLFTEQLGQTPMRALRHARLRHAARLLEATDLPVTRVAAASGFTSPFHFNRVFRQRYGVPPGVYRTAYRVEHGSAHTGRRT